MENNLAIKQLQLINEIYMDDELVVFDHIKLNPATAKYRRNWIYGRIFAFRIYDRGR